MITAPAIGIMPTPELNVSAGLTVDHASTGFAYILQEVTPVARRPNDVPQQTMMPTLQLADADMPSNIEAVRVNAQPLAASAKLLLPVSIVDADKAATDCPQIVVQSGALPVALKSTLLIDEPQLKVASVNDAPEKKIDKTKATLGDEPLNTDHVPMQLAEELIFKKHPEQHRINDLPVMMSVPEKPVLAPQVAVPLPERNVVADVLAPKLVLQIDRIEVQVPAVSELRGPSAVPTAVTERVQSSLVERGPIFAPMLMQISRDVLALSPDRDVRFNVRPDVLGLVAVTIERTDAGANLRLGVETQAAVQAVRAAEPMLNDNRGSAPFVQVAVDMNAPDQRSRNGYRTASQIRRNESRSTDTIIERGPVVTGRYA